MTTMWVNYTYRKQILALDADIPVHRCESDEWADCHCCLEAQFHLFHQCLSLSTAKLFENRWRYLHTTAFCSLVKFLAKHNSIAGKIKIVLHTDSHEYTAMTQ